MAKVSVTGYCKCYLNLFDKPVDTRKFYGKVEFEVIKTSES